MIELYQADDLTPATDLDIPDYQAGQDSGSIFVHVWNSKDDGTGQTVEPLMFVMRTEDPTRVGVYLASGVPPQDELWGRARVIGFNNRGDTAWSTPQTDWTVLGAYAGLLIANLPADCAVHLELRFHPPTTAQNGTTWRHRLVGLHSEHSQPVPPALLTRRGVIRGLGDPKHSGIVHGFEVEATGDQVTIQPGQWIHKGKLHGQVTQTVQLDQTDQNGEALEAGESYWTAFTLGDGMTVSKGPQGIEPLKPSTPPGELFISSIRVDHQPDGVSAIEPEDLDGETIYDRFLLIPGEGLDARIHAGQALAGNTKRFHVRPTSLSFEPNTTSFVWQLDSGGFEITTSDEAPTDTALLLWQVETDAVQILKTLDRRTYVEPRKVLTLRGPAVPDEIDSLGIEEYLTIERVTLRVEGLGTAGQTIADVLINGESIYTSQSTDDQRPRIPFDATNARTLGGVHERTALRPGGVVTLELDDVADGTTEAEVQIITG